MKKIRKEGKNNFSKATFARCLVFCQIKKIYIALSWSKSKDISLEQKYINFTHFKKYQVCFMIWSYISSRDEEAMHYFDKYFFCIIQSAIQSLSKNMFL